MGAIQLDEAAPRRVADARGRSGRGWAARHASLVSLAVIETVVVAWVLRAGQPLTIDTFNSHVYVLWSLTHHQQDFAWAPGGPGSYLPASWNLPWWVLVNHMPGPVVGTYLAALGGLGLWLVWLLGTDLTRRLGLRAPEAVGWLAATLGFLSAMFHVELGTTFGDIATAPLVVASVWVLVRWPRRGSAALLAGASTGAAFGLKLTNGPYALALVALAVVSSSPRVRNVTLCSLGLLAGALATGGWWWLKMAHRFGNPFFPFFASVLPSDYGADGNVADHRWSASIGQLVAMPWRMAVDGYPIETPYRDARWLVVVALLLLWLGVGLRRRPSGAPTRLARPIVGLVVYLMVGFFSWGLAFGYGRYLLAADLVVSVLLAVLAWELAARTRALQLGATLALAMTLVFGLGPQLTFVLSWHERWLDVSLPPLARQRDEVIVLPGNDGLSYVIASAPSDARIVQAPSVFGVLPDALASGARPTGLEDDEIRALIEGHDGPVVALMSADEVDRGADIARSYGRTQVAAECQPFEVHVAHVASTQLQISGVGAAGAPVTAAHRRTAVACSWARS